MPENIAEKLKALRLLVNEKFNKGDLFEREAAEKAEAFCKTGNDISKQV